MPTTVLDTDLLDRLSQKIDVDKVLRGLDAMPEEHLARLLAVADGPPTPHEPREPDPDFYGLFERQLSDEQQRVRRVVRQFMVETVEPVANGYWERAEMPFELVQPLAAMLRNALGENPAERYCTDPMIAGLVSLEVPRVDPSLGTFLGVHWGLCLVSIHLFGSDEQKERWLGPLEQFDKIGSWALTEPAHGSDAAAGLETTATRAGDSWTLTGAKKWSGNATFADVTVVWAKDTALSLIHI